MDLQFLATAKTEEMLQVVNAYYLHNSCGFAIVFIFFYLPYFRFKLSMLSSMIFFVSSSGKHSISMP